MYLIEKEYEFLIKDIIDLTQDIKKLNKQVLDQNEIIQELKSIIYKDIEHDDEEGEALNWSLYD